ncbi:MAG: enoyl-CoA hydratase/isomerase family protein, partial [Oscillospiraceae bacterium]|nr:enoyl-CoA hydratase/isomerase family protein [Oscillospiraceae bacterium]
MKGVAILNVLYEVKEHVAVLTISRPEALNALNLDTLKDLEQALNQAEADENVYVLIITGAGKAFVAGADIAQMKDFTAVEGRAFGEFGNRVFSRIENSLKPVIAAVNGYALGGGCELSMACDIRIAGTKAKFGQPEVGLGITPGFGGTQRLPRIVGLSKAKEL